MATAQSSRHVSSPISYVTAAHSDESVEKSTAASSPVQENPSPYRDARQLPRDLKAHCHIHLEEQLYLSAINLLSTVLSSGAYRTPSRNKKPKRIAIPPPSHLALLGTLVVHPLHTSRAEKQEHLDVSTQALAYLRTVLEVVGPVNADLRTAFRYHAVSRHARRHVQKAHDDDGDASDDDLSGDEDRIKGKISNEGSVWSRGQDFWSTVGWAFKCSALYPRRWEHWKLWLEFMLEVLEADWEERVRLDTEAGAANGKDEDDMPQESREGSMIVMYMDREDGPTRGIKGILKSLFADGSEVYSSAFQEVFDKELKGPRQENKKRKRDQVLDLENDKFGDYFDDESLSSGVSEPPTPQKPKDRRKSATVSTQHTGLDESVGFRLRLFKLLSAATYALRKPKTLHELYREYTKFVKLLPLETFAHVISQNDSPLISEAQITVLKELYNILLPASYKDPAKVDPEGDAEGSLSTPMLEHCYIPNPANTVAMDDNAKLSLVVESSIQLLWNLDMLDYTRSFAEAAVKGVKAREAKVKKRRTGKVKGDATDELAHEILVSSGQRIEALLEVLDELEEMEDVEAATEEMEEE